jgi:hypothetical protein
MALENLDDDDDDDDDDEDDEVDKLVLGKVSKNSMISATDNLGYKELKYTKHDLINLLHGAVSMCLTLILQQLQFSRLPLSNHGLCCCN